MKLPVTSNATAMSIAWEQVAHWSSYMMARDAAAVIGIDDRSSWETIALKLARMWLELHQHVPQHVDEMALTDRRAA